MFSSALARSAAIRRLMGKESAESRSDWPVDGLLAHGVGQGENGFRVVDVWESQEALDSLAGHLMPVLYEIGMEANPEIHPAHTFVSA